jgi:UDP-GlcNAc:undecaprenyl-phosphate/decaprenyl-phosphate GlcNAc-1-phosphate transferase
LGGLAIAISVVVLTFAAVIRSDNTQTTFPLAATLLFPAIFLGLMGLIDDLASLNPLPRLIIQTVMAIAVAIFLNQIQHSWNHPGWNFPRRSCDDNLDYWNL